MANTLLTEEQSKLAETWEAYVTCAATMPDDIWAIYLEGPEGAKWLFIDTTTSRVQTAERGAAGIAVDHVFIDDPRELTRRGTVLMNAAMADGSHTGRFSRISPDYANAIYALLVRWGTDPSPVPEQLGSHYLLQTP